MDFPLLDVSRLTVVYKRGLGGGPGITAVKNISFTVEHGQRVGLIGESGSGKSTVLSAAAGLIKPSGGTILFKGEDIAAFSGRKRRAFRREVAMLFQSAAVDPLMKIHDIIAEPLRNFEKLSRTEERRRVGELLELAGLTHNLSDRYPKELSGGQLQRVSIARSLALRPSLLLADEPITALDAPLRVRLLETLLGLSDELNIACVFVTHDMTAARYMCDSVCVMRRGEIVERGVMDKIYEKPENLYTKLLVASILPEDAEGFAQSRQNRAELRARLMSEDGGAK